MNLILTERDKKLLGLTACLAILAVFGVHLIRPALAEQEALKSEYEAARQKQQEYQAQIDARAALDDSIAQNEAALRTAGEPYYPGGLETRQMDDIITGLALKNGLFPQSLTLTEAVPGAGRACRSRRPDRRSTGRAAGGRLCRACRRCRPDRRNTGRAADGRRRLYRHRDPLGAGRRQPVGCTSSTRWSAAARGCA